MNFYTKYGNKKGDFLYFWLEGKLVSNIVSEFKEGSGQYIFESDLERIGETSSFILEAIANSFVSSNERIKMDIDISHLQKAFKSLASRIKYGLNDPTLLRIAKRQIPGVERADLIRLKMDATKAGYKDSVLMFIKQNKERCRQYFSEEQLESLQEHFRYRNDVSEMLTKTERFQGKNMLPKWKDCFPIRLRNRARLSKAKWLLPQIKKCPLPKVYQTERLSVSTREQFLKADMLLPKWKHT